MTKYLLDTNMLLDIVIDGRPRHSEVVELTASLSKDPDNTQFILVSTLKDVYYTFCKHYGSEETARSSITRLHAAYKGIELTNEVIEEALGSDEPDFEDGLVRAAAELGGCDYIITADDTAFYGTSVGKLLVGLPPDPPCADETPETAAEKTST